MKFMLLVSIWRFWWSQPLQKGLAHFSRPKVAFACKIASEKTPRQFHSVKRNGGLQLIIWSLSCSFCWFDFLSLLSIFSDIRIAICDLCRRVFPPETEQAYKQLSFSWNTICIHMPTIPGLCFVLIVNFISLTGNMFHPQNYHKLPTLAGRLNRIVQHSDTCLPFGLSGRSLLKLSHSE